MARTNIDLDSQLVKEGLRRTHCKTKRELVNLALRELVRNKRAQELLKLSGKITWEGDLKAWRMDHA